MEGGLSFGLSGFQFWSHDIGGFCGEIHENLLIRWMQVGMFISHSRIHGFGDREPYKFDPETQRICGDYIRLRYRLHALYLRLGAPMRGAIAAHAARRWWSNIRMTRTPGIMSDEFLFGDSLLVAPCSRRRAPPRLPARRRVDGLVEQSPHLQGGAGSTSPRISARCPSTSAKAPSSLWGR